MGPPCCGWEADAPGEGVSGLWGGGDISSFPAPRGFSGAAWGCLVLPFRSLSTSWWPKIFFLEVLEVSHISADLQIRLQMSLFEMIRGESFCPTASI